MKLSTTITLLSVLICSEAMNARAPNKGEYVAADYNHQSDYYKCNILVSDYTRNLTKSEVRLCLQTSVTKADHKMLNRLLKAYEQLEVAERVEVSKIFPSLVFSSSVDERQDLLADLLIVTDINKALIAKSFRRAAGEGSIKALKRWIEQLQGEVPMDVWNDAVIDAWGSGHRKTVDFIFRSPHFPSKWDNPLVVDIYHRMYPGGQEQHTPIYSEQDENLAVESPENEEVEEKKEAPVVAEEKKEAPAIEEEKQEKPVDQVYQAEAEPELPSEDSGTQYFSFDSTRSAEDEDSIDDSDEEKPEEPKPVDEPKTAPSEPAERRAMEYDPLDFSEDDDWIARSLRENPRTEKPKPTPKPAESSWWGGLTRFVTDMYSGIDVEILPESTWDSTYGAREIVHDKVTRNGDGGHGGDDGDDADYWHEKLHDINHGPYDKWNRE